MMQVNVKNAFNNFFVLLFLENYEMPVDVWQALFLLPNCFMVLILFFFINMGNTTKESPLLNHFQA
jgi:hypothetical protein